MTVKELQEKLKEMPPSAEVIFRSWDYPNLKITEVKWELLHEGGHVVLTS